MKHLVLPLLPLFMAFRLGAQSAPFVPDHGITSPFHQAHVGEILFSAQALPATAYVASAFAPSQVFTPKSSLFMTVFLGTSLTNALHALAPDATAEELTQRGNFQFTFLVDQQPVYVSNLHPGAPYAALKHAETVWHKPLVNNETATSWWSQSLWNRFLAAGGEKALRTGPHLLRVEIRPYLHTTRLLVGPPLAAGQVTLVVKPPVIDPNTIRLRSLAPYPGLPVSRAHLDTAKIKALKANIEAGVFKAITSVVVLKQGQLLVEEYFQGATRATRHDPRSVGKSFASTLTGLAIADGFLRNEFQPLRDFYDMPQYPHYTPAKARITLSELLTMRSALAGNDEEADSPGNEEHMYPTSDWVRFALSLPVDSVKPRGQWAYFTAGAILLGDVLEHRVPGGLEAYADRRLFRPLGITDYRWQYTPQHVANTAGGVQLRALDFAKYGLLYQNGGRWQGQQLLPAAWVAKTLSHQVALPHRVKEYYGYLFWNKTYHVQGKSYETYYCAGNGGNTIFVFKDQPLVVVVTATAYGASNAHAQVDKMMTDFILPAVLGTRPRKPGRAAAPPRPRASQRRYVR
ncbi:serine hydrolase domain-containing protein [Hymenobacter fodinae]|uniref:Class C beta-lactamase-related serine hydrolase n=1 Tax=Hymenobacter fodinae TaxID=2510796 RepID=A0A4Z0P049_9BACT|nr:serine hydrolase [Hymenobacter fodinae]TGE03828.1 class C beta-lactamase-related serine hydrolase [Hymenobacter fodinae]